MKRLLLNWIHQEINQKLLDRSYVADEQSNPDWNYRIIYHMIAQGQLYSLVAYQPSQVYPQGRLELSSGTVRSPVDPAARKIYSGNFTRSDWSQLQLCFHNNFVDAMA
jgi:hypothetical protein